VIAYTYDISVIKSENLYVCYSVCVLQIVRSSVVHEFMDLDEFTSTVVEDTALVEHLLQVPPLSSSQVTLVTFTDSFDFTRRRGSLRSGFNYPCIL